MHNTNAPEHERTQDRLHPNNDRFHPNDDSSVEKPPVFKQACPLERFNITVFQKIFPATFFLRVFGEFNAPTKFWLVWTATSS